VAYMLFERVTMDVVTAFKDRSDTAVQLRTAARFRDWIEALPLDPAIRAVLLEPAAAVEEGLRESLRRKARDDAARPVRNARIPRPGPDSPR